MSLLGGSVAGARPDIFLGLPDSFGTPRLASIRLISKSSGDPAWCPLPYVKDEYLYRRLLFPFPLAFPGLICSQSRECPLGFA